MSPELRELFAFALARTDESAVAAEARLDTVAAIAHRRVIDVLTRKRDQVDRVDQPRSGVARARELAAVELALRRVASSYRDHPDFRPDWAMARD